MSAPTRMRVRVQLSRGDEQLDQFVCDFPNLEKARNAFMNAAESVSDDADEADKP